jgi:hypothetical protein
MQLRNGKHTTHTGIEGKIKKLEDSMVSAGRQTYVNLRDLRCVFKKTDAQYLEMLMGFARIYDNRV